MKNDNDIAGKLDLEISKMFNNCQKLQLNPSEYIFYKENSTSNSYWVILIFFEEESKLSEALNDGTCYRIHEFILHNLYGLEEFQGMNFTMDFDYGKTPNSQEDFENLFSKFTKKLIKTLNNESKDVSAILGLA